MTYVVPSHPKYSKALGMMLDSMYVSGITSDEVIVVLGDYPNHKSLPYEIRSGVRYFPIKQNLFEYNAHIGVIEAVREKSVCRTNDFVLLHDTCLAGKNFKKQCEKFRELSDASILWATKFGNFNLGIYKYEAIKHAYEILKGVKFNKHFAIEMEHDLNYMSLKRLPLSQYFYPEELELLGKYDIYNEGRFRDVAHIKSMDLNKIFLWVPHGSKHPNRI